MKRLAAALFACVLSTHAFAGDLSPLGAQVNRQDPAAKIGLVRALAPNLSYGGPGSSILRDLSSFHGDSTLQSGAAWAASKFFTQYVVRLNGSGAFVKIPAPFNQNKAGQTYQIRFNYNAVSAGGSGHQTPLLAFDNGASGIGRIVLGIVDNAGGSGPFNVFNTMDSGTTHTTASAVVKCCGDWTIGLTFDGTTATFYVNGTANGAFTPTINALTLPANIYSGAYVNGATQLANIDIEEILVLNTALSADQMQYLASRNSRGLRWTVPWR